jgi:thiol-disulfide isomerase/thioredoxin
VTVLQVYIENGCGLCRRALVLAEQVRARYPAVRVEVINLSEQDVQPPDAVFAVPTFLLDRAVLSLGNPNASDLMRALAARVSAQER